MLNVIAASISRYDVPTWTPYSKCVIAGPKTFIVASAVLSMPPAGMSVVLVPAASSVPPGIS